MAYTIFRAGELEFGTPRAGDPSRGIARLSDSMSNMRANVWRFPAGTHGVRHAERVQEEVFVVLEGMPTLLLGEPSERVELTLGSILVLAPGTPVQLTNASDADAVLLIVGAPPVSGEVEYLEDAV